MSRLPAATLVSALLRQVNDAGGIGVVRARGDDRAGGILVIDDAPGAGGGRVLERGLGPDGRTALVESLPAGGDTDAYWRRRRQRDPDLWVVELSISGAERFAVLTMLDD